MYKQRDIVLVPFPFSDFTASKQRPALIISNSRLKGEDKMYCLITSNRPKDGILISDYEEGRLPLKSWVKPYKVFTMDQRVIKKRLCKISDKLHRRIITDLQHYLD